MPRTTPRAKSAGQPGIASMRLPSISGFTTNPLHRFRISSETFTMGTLVTTVEVDHTEWSLMFGFGTRPADAKPYIRTAIAQYHEFGMTMPEGIVIGGNPLYNVGVGSGMPQHLLGQDPRHVKCLTMLRDFIEMANDYGFTNGSRVDSMKAFIEHYDSGMLARFMIETLRGFGKEFRKRNHPDSIDLVADLCYETALGISYEEDVKVQSTILGCKFESVHKDSFAIKFKEGLDEADGKKLLLAMSILNMDMRVPVQELYDQDKIFDPGNRKSLRDLMMIKPLSKEFDNYHQMYVGSNRVVMQSGNAEFHFWDPDEGREKVFYHTGWAWTLPEEGKNFVLPQNESAFCWLKNRAGIPVHESAFDPNG